MAAMSDARLGAVRRLIEQVPDGAIRKLETALALSGRAEGAMGLVQDMVGAEILDRRVRAQVFSPILPMFRPPADGMERLAFPAAALGLSWAALKAVRPEMVAGARRAFATLRRDEEPPEVFDDLCRRLAEGLREDQAPFAGLAAAFPDAAARGRFVDVVALAPLARQAVQRLPDWVATLNNDHAAAIRLAFRDAVAIGEDAGPTFVEILFGHLQHPYEVLRLISLVMERPGDRYLAASELATFGERLLSDLERRIEGIRRFDAARGLEGGGALAASVQTATCIVNEFEEWLAIKREGPWGSRLHAHMRALASAVEARLREVEPAVAAALPLQPARSKAMRAQPDLAADPGPAAAAKAQALMAFLYESRHAAGYGGFASVRSKVIEALDPRIEQYAEDLLDRLHAEGDGALEDRIRARLALAAEFLGLVRDPRAAELLRRRAAAAA